MNSTPFHEVVGNVHLHTTCSDGGGAHQDVAAAARRAGLDFVIPTDHNVLVSGEEGWRQGVLMLIGEETNDPDPPRANHLLCFGIRQDVAPFAGDPQGLIDEVRRQGGFSFIAHPCERAGPFIDEPAFNWTHWHVEGYAGISIWNYMSEFKSNLPTLPSTLRAVFLPRSVIRGPFPETLALYDRLLADGRRVALIGASDAHANLYSAGPLKICVFPYEKLFRTVNLHLLLREPLTGRLEEDREQIYEAMRQGRGFAGYHALGDPRGFSFTAAAEGEAGVTFGQELSFTEGLTLEVRSPLPAHIRLLRDGELAAGATGRRLVHRASRPGVYRVEVYRRAWFRRRGWVFTNPIYVRPPYSNLNRQMASPKKTAAKPSNTL